jgi:hypothetical protein
LADPHHKINRDLGAAADNASAAALLLVELEYIG